MLCRVLAVSFAQIYLYVCIYRYIRKPFSCVYGIASHRVDPANIWGVGRNMLVADIYIAVARVLRATQVCDVLAVFEEQFAACWYTRTFGRSRTGGAKLGSFYLNLFKYAYSR